MTARHLTDAALCEQISAVRERLDRLPPGNCLGRLWAGAELQRLEAEMVRRYEVETWGADRG